VSVCARAQVYVHVCVQECGCVCVGECFGGVDGCVPLSLTMLVVPLMYVSVVCFCLYANHFQDTFLVVKLGELRT